MTTACLLRGLVPAALALLALPAAADDPLPGWQLASQPLPAPFAATCTLPGGDLVTFDGLFVDRWTAAGAYVGNLATLPSFVFASFVVTSPDGSAVVLGESSNGDILRVNADGTGLVTLANVPNNYGAAWLPGGDLVVSASLQGFPNGNDLVRVSGTTATPIGHVDGPSGPVAVAPDGSLWYATQSNAFPPPLGSTNVVRWSAAQVAAGGLSDANATLVGAGFDGGSSLAVDPISGEAYLAETNFGLAEYRIVQVRATKAASPVVIDNGADFIAGLELLDGGGPGSFEAFQPEDGRLLKYNQGVAQLTVRPRRPVLAASGPGTTGAGLITFAVSAGPPGGTLYAAACPLAFVGPFEVGIALPTFLWVTAFDPTQTRRASSFLPLDAQGNGTFLLNNPGTLQGLFAWQFLVGDAGGTFVGSTTTEVF